MVKQEKSEMSFLDHLEELRWHLVRSVLAIMVSAIAVFVFKHLVIDIILMGPSEADFFTTRQLCSFGHLLHDIIVSWGGEGSNPDALCLNKEAIDLQNINMAGQFLAHIKISLIAGIIVAFPYLVFEFWKFISPALYSKEKKHARGAVFAISILFLLGVAFGYFIIAPLSINFLYNYHLSDQIDNNIQLMSYISIVASISLASGILFELPSIIYFLSKIGLITPKFLKKYRRHALIIMLVLSAIITPPDIFSQILVCVPLIILYEISIGISRRIIKKKDMSSVESD
jgi:sec-independent protein translocase protein TatC